VKVLALDYGSARTGSQAGLARLAELAKAEDVERVVVGMPFTMRGERGEQARATEDFVEQLRAALSIPVETYDERFTTDLAQQTPSRTPEDARAAAHLLTSYLEWNAARA
jgi:putative Holliday junction resolvase